MVRLSEALPYLEQARARKKEEEAKAAASRIDIGNVIAGALLGALTGGATLPATLGGALTGAAAGSGPETGVKVATQALSYGMGLKEKEETKALKAEEAARKLGESRINVLKEFDITPTAGQGTFNIKDIDPNLFPKETYLKRKPPTPSWIPLLSGQFGGQELPPQTNIIPSTLPVVSGLAEGLPKDVQDLGDPMQYEGKIYESDNGKKYKSINGQWQEAQ